MGFIIIAACPREEPAFAPRALRSPRDAPGVARSPGRATAAWAALPGMVPRESPPSRGGTAPGEGPLWTANPLLLAFLLCELRLNLRSPVKKVFLCPSRGKKKIPSAGKQWGWDSLWCASAGCNAPGKCCLWGCYSPGISRIHPCSLPALTCLCVITVTAENLHYCAFWLCADPWLDCEHHHNAALVAATSETGQCLCCVRDGERKLLAQKGFFRSLTR